MHVEDAMRRGRDRVIPGAARVAEALEALGRSGEQAILVELRYGQWGWLARRDLDRAAELGQSEQAIQEALPPRAVIRSYPDLPLDQILRKLAVYPLLPVASRVNPSFMVGTLTLSDVHRAYGIEPAEAKPPDQPAGSVPPPA